jgi:hypothetical protein
MVPSSVSHDTLLAALELKSLSFDDEEDAVETVSSVYRAQLRHSLLSLARRAHLAVAAHELTGLPESELAQKTTVELLVLLDSKRARLAPSEAELIRYWA